MIFCDFTMRPSIAAIILCLLTCTVGLGTNASWADQSKPEIRIDDPFSGAIWQLDMDLSENYVATSSHNNLATIWRIDNLNDSTNFHVPRRREQAKRQRGVAISPNQKWLAYGVPPLVDTAGKVLSGTAQIYIFDTNSGEIVKTIVGIESRMRRLAFSPDGEFLAAGLTDGCGVRVWQTNVDWTPYGKDSQGYGLKGQCCENDDLVGCATHGDTAGIEFYRDEQGGLSLISSSDTGVRLYRLDKKPLVPESFASSEQIRLPRPTDISISNDGKKLAIGTRRGFDGDSGLKVAILRLPSLQPIEMSPLSIGYNKFFRTSVQQKARNSGGLNLGQVAWLRENGREWIYAAGVIWCAWLKDPNLILNSKDHFRKNCMVRWPIENGQSVGPPEFFVVGTNNVYGLKSFKRQRSNTGLIYMDGKRLSIVNPLGQIASNAKGKKLEQHSNSIDFRRYSYREFSLSSNNRMIVFDDYLDGPQGPVRLAFDTSSLSFVQIPGDLASFQSPNEDERFFGDSSSWRGSNSPPEILYQGKIGQLSTKHWKPSELAHAVSRIGETSEYYLATSQSIRYLEINDNEHRVLCKIDVQQEAFRLTHSADAKTLVVGHFDGTLRWYRVVGDKSNCEIRPILNIYFERNSVEGWDWIAWTPGGYFAQSPRASDIGGWLIPRRRKNLWRSFSEIDYELLSEKFGNLKKFYNPDLIRRLVSDEKSRNDDWGQQGQTAIEIAQHVERRNKLEVLFSDNLRKGDEIAARYQPLQFSILPSISSDSKLSDGVRWPKYISIVVNGTYTFFRGPGQSAGPKRPYVLTTPNEAIQFTIEVPPSARKAVGESVTVCVRLSNDRSDFVKFHETCRKFYWHGKSLATKRQMWATLIGFSDYAEPRKLHYSASDAIDIATLLITDHLVSKDKEWQFNEQLNILLMISDSGDYTNRALLELGKLAEVSNVELKIVKNPISRDMITDLKKFVNESRQIKDRDKETYENVFLFYYSGHGLTLRGNIQDSVRLVFPQADWENQQQILDNSVGTYAVQQIINTFSGQKIFIFDACRTVFLEKDYTSLSTDTLWQIHKNLTSSYLIFASESGKPSYENSAWNWDNVFLNSKIGVPNNKGNSFMGYALLEGLTSPIADNTDSELHKAGLIEFGELRDFISNKLLQRENVRDVMPMDLPQRPQFLFTSDVENADLFPLRRVTFDN